MVSSVCGGGASRLCLHCRVIRPGSVAGVPLKSVSLGLCPAAGQIPQRSFFWSPVRKTCTWPPMWWEGGQHGCSSGYAVPLRPPPREHLDPLQPSGPVDHSLQMVNLGLAPGRGWCQGSNSFCDGLWATSTVLSFTSAPWSTRSWRLPRILEILRSKSGSRGFHFLGFAEYSKCLSGFQILAAILSPVSYSSWALPLQKLPAVRFMAFQGKGAEWGYLISQAELDKRD